MAGDVKFAFNKRQAARLMLRLKSHQLRKEIHAGEFLHSLIPMEWRLESILKTRPKIKGWMRTAGMTVTDLAFMIRMEK